MAYVVSARSFGDGWERHYSDGTVRCSSGDRYDGPGVEVPCDGASVMAQQAFFAANAVAPIPNVPTYMLEAPVSPYEVVMGEAFTPEYFAPPTPEPPAYFPVFAPPTPEPAALYEGVMDMPQLPPTVLFNASPINIETGAYGLRAPRPGQPTGSIPGYNELPFMVAGNTGTGLNSSYVNSLSAGQVAQTLGAAGCALITNPAAKAACNAILIGLAMATNNSMGVGNAGGTNQQGGGMASSGVAMGMGPCPPGSMVVLGKCVNPMAMLPGGAPFISNSMGIFGVPSAAPSMGSLTVLKCARGLVLGKDNRCYAKGSIPRNARKWAPEPRPLVSRSDVKALARIKSIRGRVKKAASSAGLSCASKGSRAGARPARKR